MPDTFTPTVTSVHGKCHHHLVFVIEPVDLDLHLPAESGPHVDYLAEVGQPRPDLAEEYGMVTHLQTLPPVTDLSTSCDIQCQQISFLATFYCSNTFERKLTELIFTIL